MYSASPSPDGLLDTNIFVHAHTTDRHSNECRGFLAALERGDVEARLEPVVLHELTYVLPRYLKQMSRTDLAAYLLTILGWTGVRGDTALMVDAVERWRTTPRLAFVDAHLAALAGRNSCAVFSVNRAELRAQGIDVPQPLPG